MDVTFNSRLETYYQKFIELQEKLRKSEEERLKLEMKFNDMVQVAREEEQLHYKKLRSQYKKFLEEDRKRQERNERIILTLERIEARIGMLASKTDRFKVLRRQYQSYLQRISRGTPSDKREIPPPKIVVDAPGKQRDVPDFNRDLRDKEYAEKTSDRSNDENIDILDKYLQNLSSQKCRETISNKEKPHQSDLKYLNDMAKRFDEGFDSNRANSIAEDIMNSIYSRHYKKDSPTDDSRTVHKFTVSNIGSSPERSSLGDFAESRYASNGLENFPSPQHLDGHTSANQMKTTSAIGNNSELKKINSVDNSREDEFPQFPHKAYTVPDKAVTKPASEQISRSARAFNNNQHHYPHTPYDTRSNNFPSDYKNSYTKTDEDNASDSRQIHDDEHNLQFVQKTERPNDLENGAKASERSLNKNEVEPTKSNLSTNESNKENIVKYDDYFAEDVGLSKTEKDSMENEKENGADASEISRKDKNDECDEDPISLTKKIVPIEEIEAKSLHSEQSMSQNDAVNVKYKENEAVKRPDDSSAKGISDNGEYEENSNKLYVKDQDVRLTPPHNYQGGDYEDPSGNQANDMQQVNATKLIQEHDEFIPQNNEMNQNIQDIGNINYNDYSQDVQYDQYGQPIQYDQYGNQVIYDDSNESVQPQYDQNQQPYEQDVSYDEAGQPIQEQYNDDGQFMQQQYDGGEQSQVYNQQQYVDDAQPSQFYDESQAMPQYDQNIVQYGESALPQYGENGELLPQYDENGQIIQNYGENGQPVDMYNQQYDENGQPLVQYDENGQPLVQYDENGQPLVQYDENGQPLVQYDENGQPRVQYDGNGQPLVQYDENGQPLVQYDENGQPLIQYDEHGQPLMHYDENGQPLYNEEEQAAPQYEQAFNTGEEYQQYDENSQLMSQYEENGQPSTQEGNDENVQFSEENHQSFSDLKEDEYVPQDFHENQSAQQDEVAEGLPKLEVEKNSGRSDNLRDETSTDSNTVQGVTVEDEIIQPVQDVKRSPPTKRNVLDMLDTDSESVKQNVSKVSNDSDFDFSNNE